MREEQAVWLEKVLRSTPKNQWKILTFHHPIYSGAGERDNKTLRELWKPVFEKYSVDLVLTGHDHTYTRGQSTFTGSGVKNNVDGRNVIKNGTVYVVSVSGGKMYNLSKDLWKGYDANLTKAAENTQLFQVIHINGNALKYEAFTATGALYDAFDLIKDVSSGKNSFVEKVQLGIPERRFHNTIPC